MSEPQSPPRLSVVEEPAETEAPAAPRSRGSRAHWLLLAAMLLFAWMWLHQLEQTQRLAEDVVSLGTELSAAQAELASRDAHLREVRAGIDELASQVEALKGLAGQAPRVGSAASGTLSGAPEGLSALEEPVAAPSSP